MLKEGWDSSCPSEASPDVTIVSVSFNNAKFLLQNMAFTRLFNLGNLPRWIIVDNSPQMLTWEELPFGIEVIRGVPPEQAGNRGSLHHALGLEKGLKHVRTRYVLLMDADFFVICKGWLKSLAKHISQRRLALFGSVWHPRWHFHYRYFPSVHFMWIDLEQVSLEDIDLKPRSHVDLWWQLITNRHLPVQLAKTLQATRIRDTGWVLYNRLYSNRAVTRECLIPHFVEDGSLRCRFEASLRHILPESLCLYPKVKSCFTEKTFLQNVLPEAFAAGWEEFFWCGQPFAFHLRQVGRRSLRGCGSTKMDLALVQQALDHYRSKITE